MEAAIAADPERCIVMLCETKSRFYYLVDRTLLEARNTLIRFLGFQELSIFSIKVECNFSTVLYITSNSIDY